MLTGYNSNTMREYRKLKNSLKEAAQACDNLRFSICSQNNTPSMRYKLAEYRRELRTWDKQRRELEEDLMAMDYFKTFDELANELGTTEVILKYKFEAMRIRGFDIDATELEQYNHVFNGAM